MRKTLTPKFCIHTKPPASGRAEYFDTVKTGLCFRVTDTGVKSWSVVYRFKGELRRDTIGRFPDTSLVKARKMADETLEAVGDGIDPRSKKAAAEAAEAESEANTVKRAVDKFVAVYASQRKWRDLGAILQAEAVAPWGGRPISSITRRDILDRLDIIAERAPVRANRSLTVFRLFFKWCRGRDMIEVSPASDVDPVTVETSRERQLTDQEIVAFWRASGAKGWPFGDIYRLLLLTGCRRDEIGGLRWSEIDTDDRAMLEIAGDRIKGGKAQVVPMSQPALEIVRNLPRIGRSAFVFPSAKATKGEDRACSGYGKSKIIMDALMLAELQKMAPERNTDDVKLEPWRVHDLRRTCRSGLSRLQVPADIAELAIGHALSGIRKVYDRYDYLAEKRDALEKWGAFVLEMVTPPPADAGKVVQLAKRGRA